LSGRDARRLAGAVSLLLALCIVAGGVVPVVYADSPPPMPHQFYGTVSFDGVSVDEDTLVEAFVAGVKQAQTTVDAEGRYGYDPSFTVPGTAGAEVTFYVGGVLANETATWQSGKVQQLNLTVSEEPAPPVPKYDITMAASPEVGGNATDETGKSPYVEGAVVTIKAQAADGYRFVNWTSEPEGLIDDEDAAEAFLTMPGEDTAVTAHFELIPISDLAISSTTGGSVNATFNEEELMIEPGGTETIPDVPEDAVVTLVATPASGYRFVNWASDPQSLIDDEHALGISLTMPGEDVAVTAHFRLIGISDLAISSTVGGSVNATVDEEETMIEAGETETISDIAEGAVVTLVATPASGYGFVNWTSVPAGVIDDEDAAEAFLTMPGEDVAVTAHFAVAEGAPSVVTEVATGVTTYSANLNMSFTLGNSDSVEVRFAVRRPAQDPSWFHTPWEPKTADGTYMYPLTGLPPQADYDFKAQAKYNDTVIEGAVLRFTTAQQPGTGVGFDLSRFGCFIATAAYGTPAAEQIDVLREFRDTVLLESTLGSRFVALYYRLSPPVASFISGHSFVRTIVRELLIDPIVWVVESTGKVWRQ
jgi:hypothetical protein